MLKGHGDDIFDSLKRRRSIGTGEAFGDNHLDAAEWVSSIPVPLIQDLGMKRRKAKKVLVSVSVDVCNKVSEVPFVGDGEGFGTRTKIWDPKSSASEPSGRSMGNHMDDLVISEHTDDIRPHSPLTKDTAPNNKQSAWMNPKRQGSQSDCKS